jgi:uncharacterized protein YjbI with pentapeptide repeats
MFIALQRADNMRAVFASARARVALAAAERRFAGYARGSASDGLAELLIAVRAWAQPGLDKCAIAIRSCAELHRFLTQAAADEPWEVLADDTMLSALDLDDLDLSGATFRRASIDSCHMAASILARACFDGAGIDRCNLARANLERSSWCAARVTGTRLAGAVMVDTMLDAAVFVDCDLRGVDMSIVNRGALATSVRAEFIRCDLRESKWDHRVLSGVRMTDCRLHGTHGTPVLDGTEIERADLSPGGDGSQIALAADVRRLWNCWPLSVGAPTSSRSE